MNPSIPQRAAALLDYLAAKESGGNYRAYYAHAKNTAPLPATLGGVLQFQSDLVSVRKLPSSATGRYQFMPPTLRDLMATLKLGPETPFTDDLQDLLGFQLLKRRGWDRWIAGTLNDASFADELSKEWASMPYHTGRSYYAGDGLNASLVARTAFMAVIAKAKSLPLTPVGGRAVPPPIDASPSPASDSGPPSAPVSNPTTANTGTSIMGGLLGSAASIISIVSTGIGAASEIGKFMPGAVSGVFASVDDAEACVQELVELVADIRGGRWNEVPDDLKAIWAEVDDILKNFGVDLDSLGSAVGQMPNVPSVASVKRIEELKKAA